MAKQVIKGQFYAFEAASTNCEVGETLSERDALARVRTARDVYTPSESDAKRLSKTVDPARPEWHAAHQLGYFPHFHPADKHPELLPTGKRDGYGHIFYGLRGEGASDRNDHEQAARIGHVVVWGVSDSLKRERAFLFAAGMEVDADGAPNAYHPGRTRGLDNLDNAGHPGSWWALVTDNDRPGGNPVTQGPRDPAPGFYVSKTALENPAWPRTDPRHYVDATSIPYFVLPGGLGHTLRIDLGDLGFVINIKNRRSSGAIYADVGPRHKIGEGSIALARALGINADSRSGGTTGGVIYVVFAGSGNGLPRSAEDINAIARAKFQAWGGISKLESVLI